MSLDQVVLTGEVTEFNPEKTMATVTINASGGLFTDQIEVLNGRGGQRKAVETAVAGGLSGTPSIRRVLSAPFPVDAQGAEISGTAARPDNIAHYRSQYLIAGGLA